MSVKSGGYLRAVEARITSTGTGRLGQSPGLEM